MAAKEAQPAPAAATPAATPATQLIVPEEAKDEKHQPLAVAAESKPASDKKIYECTAMPAWKDTKTNADRPLFMLTVQDTTVYYPKNIAKSRENIRFPDMFYLIGEHVSVGKKDAVNLAKAFKPKAADTAEWPSGLITVTCGRCNTKVSDGHFAIQKHLRMVGEQKDKISCRLMPRLFCEACYLFMIKNQNGLPLPASTKITKSYWSRWIELEKLVEFLSEDFLRTMSKSVAKGRELATPTINEYGQQIYHYVKPNDASLLPEQQVELEKKMFGVSLESSAAAPTAIFCATCKKAQPDGTKFALCARCRSCHYCSRDCQAKAWPIHKMVCVAPK